MRKFFLPIVNFCIVLCLIYLVPRMGKIIKNWQLTEKAAFIILYFCLFLFLAMFSSGCGPKQYYVFENPYLQNERKQMEMRKAETERERLRIERERLEIEEKRLKEKK